MVFDEATSALDNNTENNLIETLNKLGNDITIIAIAHRYSSLKHFDRIIKIENGVLLFDGLPKEIFEKE